MQRQFFPLKCLMRLIREIINEVLEHRVSSSRGRSVNRGVRVRSSHYGSRKRGKSTIVKGIDYVKAIEIV
jgi:hypothetical protein